MIENHHHRLQGQPFSQDDLLLIAAELALVALFIINLASGTEQHLAALDSLGVTPIHRRSFGPVKQRLQQVPLF